MTRQERHEVLGHANGANAWSTAPMWDGECLVQIQVTDVRADHSRAGQPHLRVHVGAVHVHLTTVRVDHLCDLQNGRFEHPMGGGVRDHQCAQLL